VNGNVELIARVDSILSGGTPNSSAKSGIMFRESTAANSRFVDLVQHPDNQVAFQWRDSTGGGVSFSGKSYGGTGSTKWLKLVRIENTFFASYSTDGVVWDEIGTHTIDLPARSLAGLAVTSHDNTSSMTTTFDNLQVQQLRSAPQLAVMQPGETARVLIRDAFLPFDSSESGYLRGYKGNFADVVDPVSSRNEMTLLALGDGNFAIEAGGYYLSYPSTNEGATSIGPNQTHQILSLNGSNEFVIRHGDESLHLRGEYYWALASDLDNYARVEITPIGPATNFPNDDTYVRDNDEKTHHGSEGLILVKNTGPNDTSP
jgi:hypothetical protein